MSWLTAAEALSILGVRPQTLYANVSRRRILARPDPKDPRRSLYREADVRRIARVRSGSRKAERVAAGTIEWGDPILPSGISTVAGGRLWYRGRDATELAETLTLEEVACLLWESPAVKFDAPTVGLAAAGERQTLERRQRKTLERRQRKTLERRQRPTLERRQRPTLEQRQRQISSGDREASPVLSRMFLALASRAGRDPPSHGRSPAVLRTEATGVLSSLVDAVVGAGGQASRSSLHERSAAMWRCSRSADLLRRALVLLADHELNASTFATRVTVSTGASLASGVLAGLATLSGPLHGRAALGVFEMIHEGRRQGMRAAVLERLRAGRELSGFGHPLYPDGDARAESLLRRFDPPAEYQELRAVVEELAGEPPNIDFAMAALTQVFRLPRDAPLTVFAVARSVGWLAHALEQASTGHLIRPRARYVGPPVGASSASAPRPR